MKFSQTAAALLSLASVTAAAQCKPKIESEAFQAEIKTEK